jgi:Uncharacterised protein family (UPF0175)
MNALVRTPDEFASRFASLDEMERRALEALALDEFRLGRLTRPVLKRLLGFATRGELDAFLITHGVEGRYGASDLARDISDLRRLGF